MENASKALLMAGGMLITIIIVGVLMMAWNNMREIPKTQEQIKEAEELSAFNKKYESYAKDGIRGSDLVTVVNMAVNNNEKDENKNEPDMQINVYYKITKPIEGVIREYTKVNNEWKLTNGNVSNITVAEKTYKNAQDIGTPPNKVYFKEFSVQTKSEVKYSIDKTNWVEDLNSLTGEFKKYYTKTNIGAEFRRKKFYCTDVKYHENGRISEIYYEEK